MRSFPSRLDSCRSWSIAARLRGCAGCGIAAAGFHLYQENRDKVDQFLRSRGMNIPVREDKPLASMGIEGLATLKERVEDVLAEREVAVKETAAAEKAAN